MCGCEDIDACHNFMSEVFDFIGSFSKRLIVKNVLKQIRPQQYILEGARKWGSWDTIFYFLRI